MKKILEQLIVINNQLKDLRELIKSLRKDIKDSKFGE